MNQERHWAKRFFFADIRENETKAETSIRVLGNFLRWALLLLIAALCLLLVFDFLQADEDKITYKIAYDLDECNLDAPLKFTVDNRSRKWLQSFTFEIKAYEPNYSSNIHYPRTINDLSEFSKSWDRIIPPKQNSQSCYKYGKLKETELDPSELEWSISKIYPHLTKTKR